MSYLNPKVELRQCDDHRLGRGLFARERILKGELIAKSEGRMVMNGDLPEQYTGWCCDINAEVSLCPLDFENPTPDWFINHSCDPNTGSVGDYFTQVAMRDINPGEQITIDYAMVDEDPDPKWNFKCLCGSSNCRKAITVRDWALPGLQERYRGYFQKNIQAKIDALARRR